MTHTKMKSDLQSGKDWNSKQENKGFKLIEKDNEVEWTVKITKKDESNCCNTGYISTTLLLVQ